MKEILYPIALTADGEYIHIKDAVSGAKGYFCPECGSPFVARKGSVKQHHFAHFKGAKCTGESSLHAVWKHSLAWFFKQKKKRDLLKVAIYGK